MIERKKTIIFDFDGTIVSKDSYYEFTKWLVKRSYIRMFFMLVCFPVAAILAAWSRTRLVGLNIICFIGSAFQTQSIFTLRRQFIAHYFTALGGKFFEEAISELINHQRNNHKVLILSGCPHWLLYGMTKHIGLKGISVLGSKCTSTYYSLLLTEHCYHKNKIAMARANGYDTNAWKIGYTDSKVDIPMLEFCQRKVLVNFSLSKIQKIKQILQGKIETRKWK